VVVMVCPVSVFGPLKSLYQVVHVPVNTHY